MDITNSAEHRRTTPMSHITNLESCACMSTSFEDEVISHNDLEAALTQLPSHYQDVIRLRYFDCLDWNRVAEVLDQKSAKVRKDHERAAKALRPLLASDIDLPVS